MRWAGRDLGMEFAFAVAEVELLLVGMCGPCPARSFDGLVNDNMAAPRHPAAVASPGN